MRSAAIREGRAAFGAGWRSFARYRVLGHDLDLMMGAKASAGYYATKQAESCTRWPE